MTDIPAEVRERRLSELAVSSPDALWCVGDDGVITGLNHAAFRLGADIGDGGRLVELLDGPSVSRFTDEALPAARHNGSWSGEFVLRSAGRTFPVAARVVAHAPQGVVGWEFSIVARDVSSERQASALLRDQARRDALTGLPNRPEFLERLAHALHASRTRGTQVAVLFCDLDGFKAVNDGFGHDAGDELLVAVALRLVSAVGVGDVVARFGGDEFVVLLEDGSQERAIGVAHRLVEEIAAPVRLSMATVTVGASIGLATGSAKVHDAESLLAEADEAMYVAKRDGKGRVRHFDAALAEQARRRALLRSEIDTAVGSDAFRVVYTPVACALDGALHSFEAALRWDHPEVGELGPSEFVTIAKERALMLRLAGVVVADAARRAERWNGGRRPMRTVWFTVGGQELLAPGFVSMMADAIDAAGVGPRRLGLEVPYRAVVRHPAEVTTVLQALHWMGVRIAIDDVGGEPVAPEQLLRCSADTVKLDRRIVSGLADSTEAVGRLAGLSALGRALGMQVIAKGATSVAHVELAQELGITAVQGDVVGPALGPDAIDALLHDGRVDREWPSATVLNMALSPTQVAERIVRLCSGLRRVA